MMVQLKQCSNILLKPTILTRIGMVKFWNGIDIFSFLKLGDLKNLSQLEFQVGPECGNNSWEQ